MLHTYSRLTMVPCVAELVGCYALYSWRHKATYDATAALQRHLVHDFIGDISNEAFTVFEKTINLRIPLNCYFNRNTVDKNCEMNGYIDHVFLLLKSFQTTTCIHMKSPPPHPPRSTWPPTLPHKYGGQQKTSSLHCETNSLPMCSLINSSLPFGS